MSNFNSAETTFLTDSLTEAALNSNKQGFYGEDRCEQRLAVTSSILT